MHRYVIMCIIGMINKYNFFLVAVSVKPCDIKSIYRYIWNLYNLDCWTSQDQVEIKYTV